METHTESGQERNETISTTDKLIASALLAISLVGASPEPASADEATPVQSDVVVHRDPSSGSEEEIGVRSAENIRATILNQEKFLRDLEQEFSGKIVDVVEAYIESHGGEEEFWNSVNASGGKYPEDLRVVVEGMKKQLASAREEYLQGSEGALSSAERIEGFQKIAERIVSNMEKDVAYEGISWGEYIKNPHRLWKYIEAVSALFSELSVQSDLKNALLPAIAAKSGLSVEEIESSRPEGWTW